MCSIGGFIAENPLPDWIVERLSRALIFYGQDRGKQSAGVYVHGEVMKKAVDPDKFIQLPAFLALVCKGTALYALTHTRAPTSGGRGDDQAQPFQHGKTVLVHNGVLSNSLDVARKMGIDKPSGVDSELLALLMEKAGPDGFGDAVRDLDGSASIAVVHDGVLYVGRDCNPFEYLTLKDPHSGGDVTVFGSTQSQVLDAVRHVWLIGHYSTKTLPMKRLFKMTANKTEDAGDFRLGPETHSRRVYQGSDEYYGWGESWPERAPGRLPFAGRSSMTQIEPDVLHKPHPKLGYGFYLISPLGVKPNQWAYSETYARRQKASFPPGVDGRDGEGRVKGGLDSNAGQPRKKKKERRGPPPATAHTSS